MTNNLYACFRSRFPADENKPFILQANGRALTYADLEQQTAQMAGTLLSLGISKADRVAVQVEKTPEAVILYLACLRIGAIYLPLNTAYTSDELGYFIGDATPGLLVCAPAKAEQLAPIASIHNVAHLLTLDGTGSGSLMSHYHSVAPETGIADVSKDDVAAILYTSGTTGRSKGAMLTHENLASNAAVLHSYWGWNAQDTLLHALPIFHVHGLFVAIHCVLMNGSAMWFLPKFDVREVMDLLPHSTVLMGVPTFYTRLLEQDDFTRTSCANMRLFISGSAPLLEDTFTRFRQRTGMTILERYGMTEAGMITSNPLEGERVAGTVGYPLPGVSARLARTTAPGETGVLEIKGPNVFKGYWNMPEKTAEEFTDDGYFITGDIACLADDQRISIVGRAKDLIISGGYNVYPKEIELIIDAVEGVRESAVIAAPHPDLGEAVVAVVVPHDGYILTEQTVLDSLEGQLARFKQPKKVLFYKDLPRNTMGKVQKALLRKECSLLFPKS
ncbi:malonyl-CoA synthase [Kiloniella laminariae]|uniref:Malonyl-CoA synthase n=1 Tax=Kiloniella laminariae TaxID=454162 RepID=A0ABT4LGR9_9PROT|nr:malonyl-CoA synthase [Kiloniella laminariae]MCZ4280296.1 malonyl-CoA synthase [Kiloniella laminariae]